jgi:transposase
MGIHHTNDYKLQAVKYYIKSKNYVETSKIFDCSRTSLMRWVDRFNNFGDVKNNKRPLKSYKITNKHVLYAKNILKLNKLITLEELNKLIKTKFNDYNVSSRWLGKVLKDNFITRKRTKRKHFPDTRYGKKIDFDHEVKLLFNKIKKYLLKDIISIDETSIKPTMIPEYCRSEKGKRCYYKSSDNKIFRKYTLIVAISMDGLIGYELYEKGGITTNRFLDFINNHILKKFRNKLLLFDNAKAHIAQQILNTIKERNDYVLNVPYTPKFNPIESYFSQLKHYLKLDSEIEFDKLKISLKNAFTKIKKDNYKNYFYNSLDKSKLKPLEEIEYINKHIYKN